MLYCCIARDIAMGVETARQEVVTKNEQHRAETAVSILEGACSAGIE